MISINVIPKNLRKKKKKSIVPGGLQIPQEVFVGLGGGLLVLLILLHIFLQGLIFKKIFQLRSLKKQWEEIKPSKDVVDKIVNEMRSLQAKVKSVEGITGQDNILWSQKLNIISDMMPRGVWLRKVALIEKTLFIEGSSISQKKNEMLNVHTLASSLKKEPMFAGDFVDFEMGSIQSRKIQQISVADFLIKIKLK